METVNYGTFSASVHRGAATERLPLSGTIEVTRRESSRCEALTRRSKARE